MQFVSFKALGHRITEELYQYTRDLLKDARQKLLEARADDVLLTLQELPDWIRNVSAEELVEKTSEQNKRINQANRDLQKLRQHLQDTIFPVRWAEFFGGITYFFAAVGNSKA